MTLVSEDYVGDQFLIGSGEANFGFASLASMTDTDGLAVWSQAVSGNASLATIEDAALSFAAGCACAVAGLSSFEEDIIFITESFYGDMATGALGKARMFLDPSVPVFNRYLPEGQSS